MELAISEFSNQLANFFNDWKRIEQQQQDVVQEQLSFEENLGQFFKDWRKVFINDKQLDRFFTSYRSDDVQQPIREAKEQGLHVNVWQTAGLGKDEVKNSQVLKWFLDCRGDHGQGNKILKLFLELLSEDFHPPKEIYGEENNRYLKNYSTIAESHHCAAFNVSNDCLITQAVEENQSKTKNSRVDIEINAAEFLLFIEVKINAIESDGQLQRYYDIAQARAKDKKWAIVYLTRDGRLPNQYSNSKYIGISWTQVAEKLYQYANGSSRNNVNNRSAWLVKQFADHIKTF